MKAILRFIQEVLLRNWGLKLTAILLAFALWLMVRGSQGERVFTVPLTIQIPRNMEIVSERPSFVEITAQGTLTSLAGFQPNLTYNIDIQSAGEGTQVIPLTPAGVRVGPSSGLRVMRVSPARITLQLERVIAKDVPVKVPLRGTPTQGYDLYQLTLRPASLQITGPRSALSGIREMETEPVSLTARDQSFSTTVNLRVPDDDIHVSPGGPVEVTAELGPHRLLHTLRVPVTVVDDGDFIATPAYVSLSMLVPVTFKGRLTVKDFLVTATVPDAGPLQVQVMVKPKVELTTMLNEGILIKGISPEEITLVRKVRK
jgi:YbbR domain-containing protein